MSEALLVAGPTLAERLGQAVARLQARPEFRAFATRFAITRPVARRRAGALFDLCAGFVYSQTLLAAVTLDLPRLLAEGAREPAAVARHADLPEAAALRLLDACVALRLAVRHRDGRYALGPLGAALIDNPGVVAMIEHHAMLYRDLQDPVGLLRHGGGGAAALAGYWPYAGGATAPDRADIEPYSKLMAASQAMVATEALAAYDVRRHRCLLDVGGGDGSFVERAARVAPQLRLTVFDLPAVAELAAARLEAAGLGARARAVGGDFTRMPLPAGADLMTLVRVLHDHDDAAAMALLRAVRAALPAGGRLLIVEPMAETPGAAASGDAYFGWYLYVMGSGRPRSPARIRQMLHEAGFSRSRLLRTRTPIIARAILAG